MKCQNCDNAAAFVFPRGLNGEPGETRLCPACFFGEEYEDIRLMTLLRHAALGHRRNMMSSSPRGKTSQRRTLSILGRVGDITQRELMDIMNIRSASLSDLLAKIEADGYIERMPNEHDKRRVMIRLTESGKKAAEEARAPQSPFAALSDGEKASLAALLEKLLASWGYDWNEKKDSGDGEKPPFGGGFPGEPGFPPGGPGFPGGGFPGGHGGFPGGRRRFR